MCLLNTVNWASNSMPMLLIHSIFELVIYTLFLLFYFSVPFVTHLQGIYRIKFFFCISSIVKLLKHGMKIVERVWEKRMRTLVVVDDMEFGFMPGRGLTDALFYGEKNARRIQREG